MNRRHGTELIMQGSPELKEQLKKIIKEFLVGMPEIIAVQDSKLEPDDFLKQTDTAVLLGILTEKLAKVGCEIHVTQSVTQQPKAQPPVPYKQFENALKLKQKGSLTHEEYSKKLEEIGVIYFDAESWIYQRTAVYPMVLTRISSNSSLGENFTYEPYIMTAQGETAIRHGDILVHSNGFWSIAGANP